MHPRAMPVGAATIAIAVAATWSSSSAIVRDAIMREIATRSRERNLAIGGTSQLVTCSQSYVRTKVCRSDESWIYNASRI
eukprot:6202965-Pleurochrysis_carterae.AAC.1